MIDYGMGNLRSVSKALEAAGGRVVLSSDPAELKKLPALVLPGVGAFEHGMRNLRERGLAELVNAAVKEGKPFLGICLGLQLLFSESEEHGLHRGLDLVPGRVKKFSGGVKVPHMGWNNVNSKLKTQNSKLFDGIPDGSYFYFVHSYHVIPEEKAVIAGTTEYGGEFVSAIVRGNLCGVQFHPEKSTKLGLRVLKNFLEAV